MDNRIDIVGQVFDRLTVLQFDSIGKHRKAMWKCKCICGATTVVAGFRLRSGIRRGCRESEPDNGRAGI